MKKRAQKILPFLNVQLKAKKIFPRNISSLISQLIDKHIYIYIS